MKIKIWYSIALFCCLSVACDTGESLSITNNTDQEILLKTAPSKLIELSSLLIETTRDTSTYRLPPMQDHLIFSVINDNIDMESLNITFLNINWGTDSLILNSKQEILDQMVEVRDGEFSIIIE